MEAFCDPDPLRLLQNPGTAVFGLLTPQLQRSVPEYQLAKVQYCSCKLSNSNYLVKDAARFSHILISHD